MMEKNNKGRRRGAIKKERGEREREIYRERQRERGGDREKRIE